MIQIVLSKLSGYVLKMAKNKNLLQRLWATSHGRLSIISLLAFAAYCLVSMIVASYHFKEKNNLIQIHNGIASQKSSTNDGVDTQLIEPGLQSAKKKQTSEVPAEPSEHNSAQYDSYIASVTDTAIFFIIVSFAIGFFGFSRPEDENFERKLTYLFPDLNESKEGKDYFIKKINKMAAISPFSRHTVSFDDVISIDENYHLFRCGAIYEAQISNMHGNTEYRDNSVKLKFSLEQLKLDEIKKFTGDCKWGQLMMVRTFQDKVQTDHMKWHNGVNRNFTTTSLTVPLKELVIPTKEKINIDVHSWSWTKFGKEKFDSFTVQRFTEKLEIFFINNLTDQRIKVSFAVVDKDSITETLMESSDDLEDGFELEVAGDANSRKNHTASYFTPEKVFLWKVRLLQPKAEPDNVVKAD